MFDFEAYKRKKNSLYSQKFASASAIHATEDLQSEQLPTFLPFYIGERLIEKIEVKQNQLIYGRRGTGKSHLLGAFDESVNANSDNTLCFFISCTGVTVTPEKIQYLDERDKRDKLTSFYFRTFLNNLQDEFFKKYLHYCETILKPKLNNKEYSRKKNRIEDLILQLADEINNGSQIEVIESKVVEGTYENSEKKSELSIGSQLSLTLLKLFGKIDFRKDKTKGKKIIKQTSQYLTTDFNELRKIISHIVDEMDLSRLYICIDEWSELDRTSSLSIQPHFGHRLKHLLFNHKRISVKIASIWHDTRLLEKGVNHKIQKGLEIGQDIHIGIELDTVNLKSDEKVRSFFANLLFERFRYYLPELADIKESGSVETFFVSELFDNESNFNALIAASHGVPRDFLSLFNKCIYTIKRQFNLYCIHKNLIRSIAIDSYKKDKRSLIANHDYLKPYLVSFDKHIEKTGRRFFLARNENIKNSAFEDLKDKKIIQQIPSSLTPRFIRNSYKVFYLDYGNYFEWIKVNKIDSAKIQDFTVLVNYPDKFKDNYEQFILDDRQLKSSFICCPYCNDYFDVKNKIYSKRKICPNCAENIEVSEDLTQNSSR